MPIGIPTDSGLQKLHGCFLSEIQTSFFNVKFFVFAVRMVFYKIFVYIFSEKVRKVKTSIFIVETTVDDIKKPSF